MKTLVHVVPRAGAQEALRVRIGERASELHARGRDRGVAVAWLERLPEDPFGRRTPYRHTLELCGGGARDAADLLAGAGAILEDVAHPDLSTSLVGAPHVFVAGAEAPVRYQYLMRRNAAFDHAAYLERYRDVHSAFGAKTPGIEGYVQLHVDPEASRDVASAAGLGVWGVDSVSELHLASVETFLAAVAKSDVGAQAIADEEVFVDRARSMDFCSRVVRRASGDAA